MDCPVCKADIPVEQKSLPHSHVVKLSSGEEQMQQSKDFNVMLPHNYMKDPGLGRCPGSGAIFELQ